MKLSSCAPIPPTPAPLANANSSTFLGAENVRRRGQSRRLPFRLVFRRIHHRIKQQRRLYRVRYVQRNKSLRTLSLARSSCRASSVCIRRGIATSAIAAAASIISFVILTAPFPCACAHSTPGNSVEPKPTPAHASIKRRRSIMPFAPLASIESGGTIPFVGHSFVEMRLGECHPENAKKAASPPRRGSGSCAAKQKIVVENYLCGAPPLALPLLMPSLVTCACMCCASSSAIAAWAVFFARTL